jgi:hypothetical protein
MTELDALLAVPDWDDVLARSRRGAGRRRATAAAALAAVALVATPALALHGRLASFFDLARSPARPATWLLVGPRVRPDARLRAAARLTHVAPGSLRLVGAAGAGYRRVSLVAGIGPDGRPWLAQEGPGWANDFFPLFGAVADPGLGVWHTRTRHGWDGWHFPMYGRSDEHRRVFAYVAFGGAVPAVTGWATVVGFVRPDVARVEVVTAGGAVRTAALARGGGFGYAARTPASLPRTLRAYDVGGRLVEALRLQTAPLAG